MSGMEAPEVMRRRIAELEAALQQAEAAQLQSESKPSAALEAVAERDRVQTALNESEERSRLLASIVEFSLDAIITKDLNGVITSWNKGAEDIFGYSATEAIGRPVTILIPADRQSEEPMILDRIRQGERIDHYETVRLRKDGGLIDISLTVSPLRNLAGAIVGASKIAREITERRRAETLLTTLAREAEHRAKNVLATVAATIHLSHAETATELKRVIEGRVRALSEVHSLFVQSRWTGADAAVILAQELQPYRQDGSTRTLLSGPHIMLETATAQALAVAVHELATNAAKHGALSTPVGTVRVEWSETPDGQIHLRWSEEGGPPVSEPSLQGFGSKVIPRMIESVGGSIDIKWNSEGVIAALSLPKGDPAG